MKRWLPIIFFATIFVVLLTADLLTKYLIYGKDMNFIPGFIEFDNVKNYGIAFGLLANAGVWITVITSMLCVASIIAWFFLARKSIFGSISFAIFIAGAIGNLYDRISYGYVRDFITFPWFSFAGVFNVADACLTIATIMLAVYFTMLAFKKTEKSNAS